MDVPTPPWLESEARRSGALAQPSKEAFLLVVVPQAPELRIARLRAATRWYMDAYSQAVACLARVCPQRSGIYARGDPQGDVGSVPFLAAAVHLVYRASAPESEVHAHVSGRVFWILGRRRKAPGRTSWRRV